MGLDCSLLKREDIRLTTPKLTTLQIKMSSESAVVETKEEQVVEAPAAKEEPKSEEAAEAPAAEEEAAETPAAEDKEAEPVKEEAETAKVVEDETPAPTEVAAEE